MGPRCRPMQLLKTLHVINNKKQEKLEPTAKINKHKIIATSIKIKATSSNINSYQNRFKNVKYIQCI